MGKIGGIVALVLLGAVLWMLPVGQSSTEPLRGVGTRLFGLEQRDAYTYCRRCGTDREAHDWSFGPLLVWHWSKTSPSRAFRDLLDERHQHEWELNCVSVKSAFSETLG